MRRIILVTLFFLTFNVCSTPAANPTFRKDFYVGTGADAWGFGDSTIYQKYDFMIWIFDNLFMDTLVAQGVRDSMRVVAYISPTDMFASYPEGVYDSADCGFWHKYRIYHWLKRELADSGYSVERLFYHFDSPTNVVAGGIGMLPGTASSGGAFIASDSLARVPTYHSYYVGSGRGRILTNLGDPIARRFYVKYCMFLIDSAGNPNWSFSSARCGAGRVAPLAPTTYFDGIFLDNMGVGSNIRNEPSWISSGGAIHEDMGEGAGLTILGTDAFWDRLDDDRLGFARELRDSLHARTTRPLYTVGNVANWKWNTKLNNPNISGIDFTLTEFAPNPYIPGSFANIDSLRSNQLEQEQNGGGWVWLSTVGSAAVGFNGSVDESFVGSLCLFYVTRSDSSYFGVYNKSGNIYNPQNDIYQLGWRGVMDFDVGTPRGAMFVLTSGVDGNGRNYDVYAREYSNALVLVRMNNGGGSDLGSSVSLNLASAYPGSDFNIVNSNGTVDANTTTTVTIGKGQGRILKAAYNGASNSGIKNVAIVYNEFGVAPRVDSLMYSLVNEMITTSTSYSATLIDNDVWATLTSADIANYDVIVISPTVPSFSLVGGPDLTVFSGGVLSLNGLVSLGLGTPVLSSQGRVRYKGPASNFINRRELDSLHCKYVAGTDGGYQILSGVGNDVKALFHESTSIQNVLTASCDSGAINSVGLPSAGRRVFLGHHATGTGYRSWSTYAPFRRDIQRCVSFLAGDTLSDSYVERNIFIGFADECGNSWNELGQDNLIGKPCLNDGSANDSAAWNSSGDALRTGFDGGYAFTCFNPVGIDVLVPEDSVVASYLYMSADFVGSESGFWDVSVGMFPVLSYGGQLNVPFWYQDLFNGCPRDWKASGFFPNGLSNRYGKSEIEPWGTKGMQRGVDIPLIPMDSIRFTNNDWNQGGVISLRFNDSVMNSWVLQGHRDFIMKGLNQHAGDVEIGPWADRMGPNAILSKAGMLILLKGANIPQSAQNPIAPTQLAPTNNSTIGLRPTFQLSITASQVVVSLMYQLQVASDSLFSTIVIDGSIQPTSASTNWTPASNLANFQPYWWRVRSSNSLGTSSWSPTWKLNVFEIVTDVTDSIPSPSMPCGITYMSLIPTFEVNNVSAVSNPIYTFEVARDSFFIDIAETSPPILEGEGGKTAWTMSMSLVSGQQYYWRASVNNLSPSSACAFIVESVPHAAPNPFDPLLQSFVTFHDLPESAELVIMTLDGQTVQHWQNIVGGKLLWDGRNEAGQTVSSQVYLWFIVGSDKRGKLVVRR